MSKSFYELLAGAVSRAEWLAAKLAEKDREIETLRKTIKPLCHSFSLTNGLVAVHVDNESEADAGALRRDIVESNRELIAKAEALIG